MGRKDRRRKALETGLGGQFDQVLLEISESGRGVEGGKENRFGSIRGQR